MTPRDTSVDPPDRAAERPEAPKRRRVLVVDDDEDSAISLAMLLKLRGYETAIAHDGHEAARRIRLLPGGKDTVLIPLTGWAQEEDRRRTTPAGFDEHMLQPLDFDALLKRLAI